MLSPPAAKSELFETEMSNIQIIVNVIQEGK